MPTVTIRYTLPDEQADYDAARLGSEAMQVLWQIDQTCRSLLKHGTPTEAEAALAERIREMIPAEMLDI
jgi:glutamate-1-semialdehyde aminotransferase